MLILLLTSCTNKIDKKYCNTFTRYLDEVHQINVTTNEDYYIVVPLQGCESCIFNLISVIKEMDKSVNHDFVYIYVGKYLGKNYLISDFLEENDKKILYDNFQKIFSYETGFAYPLLIKIKNGKYELYEELPNTTCRATFERIF